MMMMEGRGGVYLSVFYGVGPVVYKHTVPFLAGSGLDTVPIVPPSSLPTRVTQPCNHQVVLKAPYYTIFYIFIFHHLRQ